MAQLHRLLASAIVNKPARLIIFGQGEVREDWRASLRLGLEAGRSDDELSSLASTPVIA